MKFFKTIITLFLGAVLCLRGILYYTGDGKISRESIDTALGNLTTRQDTNKYQRFEEIYKVLESDYVDQEKINSGKMIEYAVKAYVDGIDDPYTVYLDNEQNSGFTQELKGETDFEGIGAVVSKKDYYVLVEEVIKESPAFKGGIKALDRIIFVETGSVKNLDINEAVDKIKGPEGSTVKLIIERHQKDGNKDILEKNIVREKLNIPSVTTKVLELKNGKKVGYINISVIGEATNNILRAEIEGLKKQGIAGVIMDLRGNGGGLLPIAVDICGHFIPEGKIVVSAKYRSLEDEIYTSEGFGELENYPMIVLVDGITASAGEIIAMALQEQIGAKLVGEKTFGKGTIQTMEEFTDGTSMKYTIGKRYSPSDKNINETGVTPDIEVAFDEQKYIADRTDTQLEKAKEVIATLIK